MRLVVGLGNPGRRYRGTRHNVGFRVVDLLAQRWGVSLRPVGSAEVAQARFGGQPVLLAKPLTYMNLSGEAVAALVRRWRIPPSCVLVVYDDMDLPTGALRVRARGSAGGHRGMASVLEALGTSEVPRVRVGIGRPGTDAVDHVLSRFTEAEEPLVAEAVERAAEAVETVLREGVERAMDRFNRKAAPASAG